MKKILVLGAGRSSISLIDYLLQNAAENDWRVNVGDLDISLAEEKINKHPYGEAIYFNVAEEALLKNSIGDHDLVISLLPAELHPVVASACIGQGKHLLTASYVSEKIADLDQKAKGAGVLILMETGLDPGIDHMSAMEEIEHIHQQGGQIISFRSYTGGLVAPESDDNPWHYKISWNPRNVVLAGQGTASFLQQGRLRLVPYHHLFRETVTVNVEGAGELEGYPNRDSMQYLDKYPLPHIQDFVRGTFRRKPFCSAWNILVQLGMTSDSVEIKTDSITKKDLLRSFLPASNGDLRQALCDHLSIARSSEAFKAIEWLGLFDEEVVKAKRNTPAGILQEIIEDKLKLSSTDKDMIVMLHEFIFRKGDKVFNRKASLVVKGDDRKNTAMAKTVGLPLAIAARSVLKGDITARGVQIPVSKAIFGPILEELGVLGIAFNTSETDVS